ncbi:family 20 glycosylhydrolase [Limibacter armeniacum]|uniref:glycoside hydrolase family 20 protein n=1 Tax=Limibacter armeniacum TaxID=466084 RepID=UPI002FE68CC3
MNRLFHQLLRCLPLMAMVFACSSDKDATSIQKAEIVPQPKSIQYQEGKFVLNQDTPIIYPEGDPVLEKTAELLQGYIMGALGFAPKIAAGTPSDDGIVLTAANQDASEAYELTVSNDRILINGQSAKGTFYGVQSLRQLIPAKAKGNEVAISAMQIQDSPRFSYRGMHLDVARHFFDTDFVKTYIDLIAMHKMNTFHWHLTEDQGWRIEIKKYPKLTSVGSQRKETVVGHAGRSNEYDGQPYGGFYTQEEIKEIVQYAQDRFITVIPEIELPGHSLAALAAYPQFGCKGEHYDVATTFGIFDEVYCAGNDSTFLFLQDVLDEVVALFPSEYIHIGGDECPKASWENCPKCQARINSEGLEDEHELQSYFIRRIEKYLNSKGRQIIGWDEILEGGLAPNATVMSWRGMHGGIEAARQKHDVIMTPGSHVYFDHYQSLDKEVEPLAIGGFTTVSKVYEFEPVPEELSEEEQQYVKGAQANVWTEYMKSSEQVEYMILPRMAALSEVLWSAKEDRNLEDFKPRLLHAISYYEQMGLNYAKHIFDAEIAASPNPETGKVEVALSTFSSEPIYYTLDGSEPNQQSEQYKGEKLSIDKPVTLKATTFLNGEKGMVKSETIQLNIASFKPMQLLKAPSSRYEKYTPALNDGLRGIMNFGSGAWVGFLHGDLEAVIDLKQPTEISEVKVGTLVQAGSWIFGARSLKVYTSDDGKAYKEVASETFPETTQEQKDMITDLTASFDKVSAHYLKVVVERQDKLPEWHKGSGQNAYLFVDEIIVQ